MFLGTQSKLSAQEQKNQNPVFTVRPALNEPAPDSVHIIYAKGIINGSYTNRENIFINKKNTDGSFTFSFSGKQPISPFSMLIWYGKTIQNSNTYYAEPSDTIEIFVAKGKTPEYEGGKIHPELFFSGVKAAKYKVNDILSKLNIETYKREVDNTNKFKIEYKNNNGTNDKTKSITSCNSIKLTEYLNILFKNVASDIKRNQDTILKHEGELGKKVSDFYNYELNPYMYFRWSISALFRNVEFSNCQQEISDFYFSKIDMIRPEPIDSWLKYGIVYRQTRSDDFLFETNYKTKGMGSPLYIQYNEIKSLKNTELRDILLTKFFEEGRLMFYVSNYESRDSCLNDALKFVKDPELRSSLNNQLLFAKGSKVYNFSFPDSTGKRISLSDLKGKVFMLDFYYYGCGPCSIFTKEFEKKVYPEFEKNPDFKVLSIDSYDNLEIWKKAIKSGLYTLPNSINLVTGLKFKHPIFNYYGINSLPFVLLVDKNGKLITRITSQTGLEITKIIREALKQNNPEISGK